ncbi:hypothetical protein evm_008302 [Chilo suppressalis]|nr:hypothetical protein evm_008302 [Chilo suppressalis]
MEHQLVLKTIKKRVRSSNWDEEEKRLLRHLIMDKIDIVEKKECSTNTNALKKAAWQEILCSFNTINKKQRDMTQLITQWRNMKGQVKSRESEYRRARLMTGGGPPPPSPPPEDREILQIIPNEFVVDSNCFDSDSLFMKTITQSQIAETESEVTLIPTVSNERIDIEKSVESSNPQADVEETVVASPSLQSTPLASTYDTVLRSKNIKRKLYKPKNKQNQMMDNDYEQQLFLLAKKSKENQERREDEIHKKKMIILDLEQKYWEKKIMKME